MGLSLIFRLIPTPSRCCLRDGSDDGLSTRIHMDMLNRDLLLAGRA